MLCNLAGSQHKLIKSPTLRYLRLKIIFKDIMVFLVLDEASYESTSSAYHALRSALTKTGIGVKILIGSCSI